MEQKFYDLDVKVTKIQSVVEKLQDEVQEKKGKSTTDAFILGVLSTPPPEDQA